MTGAELVIETLRKIREEMDEDRRYYEERALLTLQDLQEEREWRDGGRRRGEEP